MLETRGLTKKEKLVKSYVHSEHFKSEVLLSPWTNDIELLALR